MLSDILEKRRKRLEEFCERQQETDLARIAREKQQDAELRAVLPKITEIIGKTLHENIAIVDVGALVISGIRYPTPIFGYAIRRILGKPTGYCNHCTSWESEGHSNNCRFSSFGDHYEQWHDKAPQFYKKKGRS